MTNISIGKDTEINIEKLVATRMLISANSGGGKSYLIRKVLEESHGKVQHIVIDLEGEFTTLREKFDYLLIGKEGEVPASIKTAELLAKKLLQLNVSTIIDLSELKQHERILFVKRFLDSLINVPKNLWKPCLIIVDEAHQFCPEKSKSESGASVIDLMTRGRKRGFCGILATQRISKLHKDACAEANNYLMGRTFLDIDMKRTSEILGFTTKKDMRSLRDLEAGEFYKFGSAFTNSSVNKIKIDKVNTTHPDRTKGINIEKETKTPRAIKKIIAELKDLPSEVEKEARTISDLTKQIHDLKVQLKLKEKDVKLIVEKKNPNDIINARRQGYKEAKNDYDVEFNKMRNQLSSLQHNLLIIKENAAKASNKIVIPEKFSVYKEGRTYPTSLRKSIKDLDEEYNLQNNSYSVATKNFEDVTNSNKSLRAGAMNMLSWLNGVYPDTLTKQRLATISGFSVRGGTFNTYLSELKKEGWIKGNKELCATEEGLEKIVAKTIPEGKELLDLWKTKFRLGAGKILELLYENYPSELSKEDIGIQTDFTHTGGTFNTYLGELKKNNLISIENNFVKISKEFFE